MLHDHMSFRVTVKTLPGKQWGVQRKLQAKILNAMHAEGHVIDLEAGNAVDVGLIIQ